MKIKVTEFGKRHFDKKFVGTKISNTTSEEFEKTINDVIMDSKYTINKFDNIKTEPIPTRMSNGLSWNIFNGYVPFCKLLVVENFTDAKVGSMPITLENYQYLRSGYSARRDFELPVFSRWLELPLPAPKAEFLVVVLYSKEQIEQEDNIEFDADWGIVAILGQSHYDIEPMKPETMIRNSMGIEYGGSGVELNKDEYLKSCDFWGVNATVKN